MAKAFAKSSLGPREARAARWEEIAGTMSPDPYALTPALITRTMAVLDAAEFRTTAGITEQAIATFKKRNGEWSGELRAAFIDARQAAPRGIGPVRHTAPFPFERVLELRNQVQARLEGGPLCPRRVDIIACSWLLREIEAANATVGDIRVENGHTVVFLLPASKTDPSAIGVSRSHKCACGKRAGHGGIIAPELCPACAAIEHCEFVKGKFGDRDDLPLFPDASGRFVSKAGMTGSIVEAARELGLPTVGHGGAELFGGHAWRRGGAQYLARAGVEIWRIQALARHSSSAILGYIENAHIPALAGIAAEAAIGRSLAMVRHELEILKAQVASEKLSLDMIADPPGGEGQLVQLALEDVLPEADGDDAALEQQGAELPGSSNGEPHPWVYVTSTRPGGKVHTVNPSGGKVAFCGWKFRFTTMFKIGSCPMGPDPDDAKLKCRGCSRGEEGMPTPPSEGSASE